AKRLRKSGILTGLSTLNNLAPFLVPEEKCPAAIFVVNARYENGAAKVIAKGVISQFGLWRSIPIGEVVIGIEIVVANEFPGAAMEIFCAALYNHCHDAAGTLPVFRIEVAG